MSQNKEVSGDMDKMTTEERARLDEKALPSKREGGAGKG